MFKCSSCNTLVLQNKKYEGFSHITLPQRCPSCGREFRDIKAINVVEPRIARDLDYPLYSGGSISNANSMDSVDDGIDDAEYTDHVYPVVGNRLLMRFNVPEYSRPFTADRLVSRVAHRGMYSKLSVTREKVLADRILFLSRMLSVVKRSVIDTTFNIVNDIVSKSEKYTIAELDKLVAVTLYLTAHMYGVSASKEVVMDVVGSESEFRRLSKMVLPRLRLSKAVLIGIAVSELASAFNLDERMYVRVLRFALQLRYLSVSPMQIACLAMYVVYNAYALVSGFRMVSQSRLGLLAKTVAKVRVVEILLA